MRRKWTSDGSFCRCLRAMAVTRLCALSLLAEAVVSCLTLLPERMRRLAAGYWAYRKWQVRKAIRAEAAKASGYFANVPCAPQTLRAEQMHL